MEMISSLWSESESSVSSWISSFNLILSILFCDDTNFSDLIIGGVLLGVLPNSKSFK